MVTSMSLIDNLENMLANGQDTALLRFSLGNAYLKTGDTSRAIDHLRMAVKLDPNYSAAWKNLGRALTEYGETKEAIAVYEEGIQIADGKGDLQAVKEMGVFLKRLK